MRRRRLLRLAPEWVKLGGRVLYKPATLAAFVDANVKRAKDKKATTGKPREGTHKAQVIAMLQRKGGASLEEIMKATNWQKHTVRGFMAGAMKKAGYTVESFKSDKGERSYRINP